MTIGKKLIGGFCIILSLIIILSAVFFYTIDRLNNSSDTLVENLTLDMFLDEKLGDHFRWLIDLSDQLLLGKPFEGELDPHKCDFGRWYYSFHSNDPDVNKIHAGIEEPHRRLHHSAQKIKDLYEAGAIEEAKRVYMEETEPAVEELDRKIEALLVLSTRRVNILSQEYEATGNISQIIVTCVVLVSIMTALVIAILISHKISSSIRKLKDASSMIAKGDLDTQIKIRNDDEIGDLAISFNKMVKDLRHLMHKKKALAAAEARAEVEKKRALELNQIYNGSPSGIRVVDVNFNIMSQNEAMAKLSGTTKGKAKGLKCYEQFKGALCDTTYCPLKQILNGKNMIDTEVVKESIDGKKFPCRVMASPYKDITGNTIGIIEVFTDITELKETEERLIRAEKLAVLGELGATLGHELRNPLCALENAVFFLKTKLNRIQDEKIMKHLDIMDEEIATSNKIINDILTFCRVKEPQLTKVNICNAVKGSLAKVHVPDNIDVCINIKDDLPPVTADEIQLKQVFSNIILNAIQAMSDKGVLTITGHQKDTLVEVGIFDTGKGIPKENLNKIFEPLFSTKAQGTGLGLSVCQRIIEMHQGNIDIESETEKGTKFFVQLPITYHEGNKAQESVFDYKGENPK